MKNLANQPPSNAGQRHSDRLARPSRLGPALQAFAALEAADWKARGILPNYCRHVVIQVGFNSQSAFSLMKAVFDS
jgi:hypothetical protein